jgi:hypothetical protein
MLPSVHPVLEPEALRLPLKSQGPSSLRTNARTDNVFYELSRTDPFRVQLRAVVNSIEQWRYSHLSTKLAGQDLERLLMSAPRVSSACLLTARGVPFDEHLVALINLSETSPPKTKDVLLPSRSEYDILRTEIALL